MKKIADGNKPINVGDPSYIYKGVYNPIYWIGDEPYRPRVETLVIKDGRFVYANIDDNIEEIPSDLRYKHYSIPGGSLDADSTKLEQAEAETNEEALVKVSLLYNTGISYYQLYEPGYIARGGDTPLEYVGSISDIFIGIYAGPYDKSLVDEKDLDPPMAEHGKFHDITTIAKYLRKEHIEALLASQFVREEVKTALRLDRKDIINESTGPIVVPGRFIYHASTYKIEEFKPMALDLGNLLNPPGWSTFCHESYNDALVFGMLRAIQKWSKNNGININPIFNKGHIVFTKEDFNKYCENNDIKNKFEYYLYTIDSEPLRIELGNDSTIREYTFRESGVKPESVESIKLSLYDLKEYIDIVDEAKPEEYNDYKDLFTHEYGKEDTVRTALVNAVNNGELKPGDDIEEYMATHGLSFDNDDVAIPDLSIGIDEPILEAINIYSLMEEKYPIECYGLPNRKAYPMPDAKHVKSAIRFFNYAKPEEEKELASNINKKIKEFKINDINVGKSNRFKKYYKPISESYSLKDYLGALESVQTKIEKKPTYTLYEQAKNIIKLMAVNLEAGTIDTSNVSDNQLSIIVDQCYNALAEINQDQIDLINPVVESDNRSKNFKNLLEASLSPVLEADDDEEETETATDYTAMADDAEKENENDDDETEDNDDNSAEDTDDATDVEADDTPAEDNNDEDTETATDYTAMADDAGAGDDDTDTDEGTEGDAETTDTTEEPEEPTDDSGDTDSTDTPEDSGDTDTIDDTGDATDYTAMADDAGAGDDTGGDTGDTDTSTDESTDDSSSDDTSTDTEETDENNNRYDNKELKNYFLLNSFLSLHETVVDLLDSASGVILPTPDANGIMSKVVKNLQDIKTFIEKFIQFQFSEKDYTFNLYYYNILTNALRMNLKLLEEAVKIGEAKTTKKKQLKEE